MACVGDITLLALSQIQQRHDRRALMFRRVFGQDLSEFLQGILLSNSFTGRISQDNINTADDPDHIGHKMACGQQAA